VLQIDGQSLTPEELVAIGYGSCPGLEEGSITQEDALAANAQQRVEFDSEYVVEITRYDDERGATGVIGSQSIYGSGTGTRGPAHHVLVDLTPDAWEKVQIGRSVIDDVLARKEVAYGINTGQCRGRSSSVSHKQHPDSERSLILFFCHLL
jgi:hypothetical protein